jgi:hypothetical protein
MYRWMRDTHLLLGLFSALFLLMYGVSSVQMAHRKWFSLAPRTVESAVALVPGLHDARVVARALMDRGMRGELTEVRPDAAGVRFRIVRPGTVYDVAYTLESGNTKVRTDTANFMGMLNRLHHVNGLWHPYWLINAWGAFVAVISVALIGMSVTGIYLWFRRHKERVTGAVLLAASLIFGVGLILAIRAG